jgi:mannose-6-phosphate isomerase-like protein (cupin superfamily)
MVRPALAARDVDADAGIMTDTHAIALGPQEIDALPWKTLGDRVGVALRALWTDGTSQTGVLRVDPGQRLGRHTHRRHHHDYWLVDGHADVLGRWLGPGSYVHIPAGVEHDVDATETEGCTLFYAYTLVAHDPPNR